MLRMQFNAALYRDLARKVRYTSGCWADCGVMVLFVVPNTSCAARCNFIYLLFANSEDEGDMGRAKSNPQVILRPQDLVVLLRLSLEKGLAPTYATLASEVGLTASEVHAALERATLAQLARKDATGTRAIAEWDDDSPSVGPRLYSDQVCRLRRSRQSGLSV